MHFIEDFVLESQITYILCEAHYNQCHLEMFLERGDENRGLEKETKIRALANHATFITAFLQ